MGSENLILRYEPQNRIGRLLVGYVLGLGILGGAADPNQTEENRWHKPSPRNMSI